MGQAQNAAAAPLACSTVPSEHLLFICEVRPQKAAPQGKAGGGEGDDLQLIAVNGEAAMGHLQAEAVRAVGQDAPEMLLRVRKKQGLYFRVRPLLRRAGLWAGLAVFLPLLLWTQQFVWFADTSTLTADCAPCQ